ncbi:vitamin K epoxide reductase family protein [Nonlabens xiamenensis]|uniref:vitamin K epoxide reductase family protein n=1 Tax=Nonlabens xiamenensis TaxID=2341043 RepID=UPI000F60D6CF|nr:vitamin K epoxide reductase family protein [Nonlabens xiamenensis]
MIENGTYLLKRLLEFQGHDVAEKELRLRMQSDREKSLQAYSNTCDFFEVRNASMRVPPAALGKLPNYFIAQISNGQKELLVLIKKETNGDISFTKGVGNFQPFAKNHFLNEWTGVVFAVEENKTSTNIRRFLSKKNAEYIGAICIFLFALLYIAFSTESLPQLLIFCALSSGLVLSYFLLQQKYSNGQGLKICKLSKKSDCNSVINSPQAKIFNKIELTDLCWIYFGSVALLQLITLQVSLVGIIAISGAAVLPYSIYIQAVIIKKWCPLCLGIAGFIVVTALFSLPLLDFFAIDVLSLLILLSATLISIMALSQIKKGFKFKASSFENQLKYLTLWRTPQVLETLIDKLPLIDTRLEDYDKDFKHLQQDGVEII